MPEVAVKGGRIAYLVDGPADAPVLLLSNSLGTTLDSWSNQVGPLSRSFQVVRYDTRGHGRSVVSPAPYSLDLLGRDALAVLDAALPRYRLFALNAQPGVPDRAGVLLDTQGLAPSAAGACRSRGGIAKPMLASRCTTVGSASASTAATLSLATMSGGVPLGAHSPYQVET